MVRSLVLALALLAPIAIAPAVARAEAPAESVVRFPLPADVVAPPTTTKGGGGRIKTYQVPRGRAVVTDEVRAALKKASWQVLKDEPSPSGNATRIQAKKAGKLYKVSFTGDDTRTAIILTEP
ncbi:hypothetical protein BH11MYX3_BH11MYX3_20240 [soil metagenome]